MNTTYSLNLKDWIDIIISIVTLLIAIVSIIISISHIRKSNKQSLFEKRVDCFLIVDMLFNLIKDSEESMFSVNHDDSPIIIVDSKFLFATNNSFFNSCKELMDNPKNNDIRRKFFEKIEELKQNATAIELLFNNKDAKELKEFIICYSNYLYEIYNYKMIIDIIVDLQSKSPNLTTKSAAKEIDEITHRKKLIKTINKLKESYSLVKEKKILKSIKKKIKL